MAWSQHVSQGLSDQAVASEPLSSSATAWMLSMSRNHPLPFTEARHQSAPASADHASDAPVYAMEYLTRGVISLAEPRSLGD